MIVTARSHGQTWEAAHVSTAAEVGFDREVLTLLCSEPTVPVMACCTHASTGCSLGALIRDLHTDDVLHEVVQALGVLDLDTHGYAADAYIAAACL